ncbi:MAG: hypothetical protein WCL57_18070 [Chloroflexota bacterium]|nr:hypothetical protein [Chloroflexota bacterium]
MVFSTARRRWPIHTWAHGGSAHVIGPSLGAQIGVALLGDRSVIASRITLLNGLIDIAAIRNGVLGI